MRCQYVSGLLLQCKNTLPPNSSVSTSSGQSSSITDNTSNFCEKHQAFIDKIKIHANVSKSALDPGYKIPAHLSENEDILLSSKRTIPSHVFEPCCSDSAAFSEENPLRFAGYMTEKEILQQYNAALSRMIEKVDNMRSSIHSRYKEHLKKKSSIMEEQKKYKLYVKDPEERARLERLKSDIAYARYNRTTATYLQKSYRKYKAEQMDIRGKENIKSWLETPKSAVDEDRCGFFVPVDATTPVSYTSPSIKNESDSDECVKAILDSILGTVDERINVSMGKKRCTNKRLPMTDFCAGHLKLEPDIKLVSKCKECNEPCIELDNNLCLRHAKTRFVPPPPNVHVPLVPVQTLSQRLPPNKDRIPRMPTLGLNTNGWTVTNRNLSHQIMSSGFANISSIRKPEIKYDISSLSGPLVLKSRRPRDTFQKIIQSERQPNEALLAEQSKLKIDNADNLQIWKIDEDISMEELHKQCEQRTILDTTANAPLNHQPKTKRSMLRLNGANGNGIVIRGPIAIIQNPNVGNFNSNIPINAVNRNGKVNGGLVLPGCARTRVFTRTERGGERKTTHFLV